MANRGRLTPEIQEFARQKLGREITQVELRLMPYIIYVMVNEQRLEPNKVNAEERSLIKVWKSEGHICGGFGGLAITKDFYDILCEIQWLAYVTHEEPENG